MTDTRTKSLIIKIKADSDRATKEIKSLNTQVSKLQTSVKKSNTALKAQTKSLADLSTGFKQLGAHMARVATIYGGFEGFKDLVTTTAKFEQSMQRLGVISQATSAELDAMEQKAMSLGETTVYSASQVADGMNSLAQAGLTAGDSMTAIGDTLNLANVGLMGIEETTLLAVKAMHSFGLKAEEMGRLTDVMATASTNSATTITELGNAYEKVGAVSTSLGYSLEDTTSSLMILADAGRTGAEAGTQLKIVMGRLASNNEAKKWMDEVGISIYDATGKLLPFRTQLENVKRVMDKLPPSMRNIKMSQIFGSEAITSANILLGSLNKYDVLLNKLINSFGFAGRASEEMMNTLTGSWKELMSAFEGLQLRIGSELSPALRTLLDDLTNTIRGMDSEEIKKFGQGLADLSRAVGNVISSLITFAGVVKDIFSALSDVSPTLAVAVGAIILLRGAVKNLLLTLGSLGAVFGTITVALAVAEMAIVSQRLAYEALFKTLDSGSDTIDEVATLLTVTSDQLEQIGSSGNQAFGDRLRLAIKDTKYEMKKLEQQIESTNGSFWKTDAQLQALKQQYFQLKQHLDRLIKKEKENLEIGKKAREAETKRADALRRSGTVLQEVTEDVKAFREEMDKTYDKRISKAEDTVSKLYQKEQKLVADIEKLQQELFAIYEKYDRKRENLARDIVGDNYTAMQKGLTDYEKFRQDMQRADELYIQAKKELELGHLKEAEALAKQSYELSKKWRNEEITHEEKVWVWDAKTRKKKLKTIEVVDVARANSTKATEEAMSRYSTLMNGVYDSELAKEVALHNQKIADKELELTAVKAQLLAQVEMLKLLEQIAKMAGNVNMTVDIEPAKQAIAEIEDRIGALQNEKRDVVIGANVEKAKAEVDGLTKHIDTVDGTVTVEADTAPAEQETEILITRIAERPATVDVDADTTKATEKVDDVKVHVMTISDPVPLEVETTEADKKIADTTQKKDDIAKEKPKVDVNKSEADKTIVRIADHVSSLALIEPVVNVKVVSNVAEVKKQITDLNKLKTTSTHEVKTNVADTIRAILALNRIVTNSKHFIHVYKTNHFASGGDVPHLATGGGVYKRRRGQIAGHDLTGRDDVPTMLTEGEFVQQVRAVDYYGRAFMDALNRRAIPKSVLGLASGGSVTSTSNTSTRSRPVNLVIDQKTYQLMGDDQVATALERVLRKSI